MNMTKVLITGKRNRFWNSIGAACARQSGVRVEMVPIGSAVIETVRGSNVDAVLYTISSEEEIELLRWIAQINPSLPVIALIPAPDARLRNQILEEGGTHVVVVDAKDPSAICDKILKTELKRLGAPEGTTEARRQISDDLHAIRSELTAILGSAELAMKRSVPPAKARQQIQEIPRGVMQIERILRHLHRFVRFSSRHPSKPDGERR
jgi:hypothetical protein